MKINKSVFSASLPTEKTPPWRAGRARAPRGAVKIFDFGGGDKRAYPRRADFQL